MQKRMTNKERIKYIGLLLLVIVKSTFLIIFYIPLIILDIILRPFNKKRGKKQ
jgi:hypothetical protein